MRRPICKWWQRVVTSYLVCEGFRYVCTYAIAAYLYLYQKCLKFSVINQSNTIRYVQSQNDGHMVYQRVLSLCFAFSKIVIVMIIAYKIIPPRVQKSNV